MILNSNKELVEQAAQDDGSNPLEKETSVIIHDFEEYLRTTSHKISTRLQLIVLNSIILIMG